MSVKGRIVTDMIRFFTAQKMLGPKIQDGTLRKNLVEAPWHCPEEYINLPIHMRQFEMELLTPKEEDCGEVILQLHGGGYIAKIRNAYRDFAVRYSRIKGYRVLSVDYRVAPEHPYPAATEDAMKAWNYLMLLGYGARDVIITGDSAGGNLALSLVLKLKEQERLLPRGIVLMSPWTDLTSEGKTFQTKAELDPVLDKEYIDRMTKAYAPAMDLTDPYISPLYGDFHGFPPVYIQVGENEILLDDSLRLYKNLIKAGVSAHIDRFPGMWHVFQMSPFKKANEAMDKNAEFIYSVCR